jgi:hypothetical protein
MANSQGLAYQFGSPATVTMFKPDNTTAVFTGLTSIESYDITHEADTEEVRNSIGEVVGHIGYNERVVLNLNLIPSGATAAAALAFCSLAQVNGTVRISGAPIIAMMNYGDVLNTEDVLMGGRFIYAGGGSVKLTQSGKAMVSITVKKYKNLTAGASVNLNP